MALPSGGSGGWGAVNGLDPRPSAAAARLADVRVSTFCAASYNAGNRVRSIQLLSRVAG